MTRSMQPSKPHHTPRGYRNNYVDSVLRSFREVLRWQWARWRDHLPAAPQGPTPAVAADLDFIRSNGAASAAMVRTVTWLGHATTLVQASGLNVLTDPIFSERASPFSFLGPRRAQPPGIALAALPHIDVVVISHNHYDHLDRESVRTLARQRWRAAAILGAAGTQGVVGASRYTACRRIGLVGHARACGCGVSFHAGAALVRPVFGRPQ